MACPPKASAGPGRSAIRQAHLPQMRAATSSPPIRKGGSSIRREDTMPANLRSVLVAVALIAPASSAFANVITDWDEKAIAAVTPMASLGGTFPHKAQRLMGMVHAAMFDAVNSIERRYRPYLAQLPADPPPSKEPPPPPPPPPQLTPLT